MDNDPLTSLRAFALKALAAEKYPRARHQCRTPACPTCGLTPLAVVVETHSGATRNNFRGVVAGRCPQCAADIQVFRFTGPHREPEGRHTLTCECGASAFWLALCERIEADEGLPGFFDEGVVAGRCADCGRQRVVVAYD